LPPEKTDQASALINLARNFGGSMGVSLSQTVLARREQFHQERLVESIGSWNPFYYDTLNQIDAYFRTHTFTGGAVGTSVAYIGQMLQTQAAILAYIDAFYALAVVAVIMIPLSLSLRSVKRTAPGPNAL
jgi:MFS transporter, DHA2 family, multidrug resistance protein